MKTKKIQTPGFLGWFLPCHQESGCPGTLTNPFRTCLLKKNFLGFTLAEIMISLAIFSVLSTGIFTITRFITQNSKKNIAESDQSVHIQKAYWLISKELRKASELSWPPLKIHSDKLQFESEHKNFTFRFENKSLNMETEENSSVIIQKIETVYFFRHNDRLMEISWNDGKKELKTFVWMQALNRMIPQ